MGVGGRYFGLIYEVNREDLISLKKDLFKSRMKKIIFF